ncbi:cytochrome P450 [Kockovaella imperatae]|uniref:Cytochrome P450 n=1 Tax=Kockovaella imperatae TaxID=4999 RepID=A0A1Y1UMG2_9TREE|nr:cytochrome P450 [Kockovaella imperatae]ORX39248.1 cytochrome P450 [Kockovaella imperatae]
MDHLSELATAAIEFARHRPVLTIIGIIITSLASLWFYYWPWAEWTLSFRNVPGPPSDNWLFGNLRAIIKAGPMELHREWAKEYGPTYRYRIIFAQHRFYTLDPKAIAHVLSHPDTFPKPDRARQQLAKTLGNGLLTAEGADHRRQRKALNPSFSPLAVKNMQDIFFDKAYELREKLVDIIADDTIQASPTPAKPEDTVSGGKKIDVAKYLGQTTLDVIGLAGFNYDFQSLSQKDNELAEAYRSMFAASSQLTLMLFLAAFVPGFDKIPTKQQRTVRASQEVTRRIGNRLLEEKKRAVKAAYSDGFEKGSDIGKDLLSILVKANMASDVPPDQRMSDDEVLAQITTFMLAGNETSSTSLTWILYLLCQHPEIQTKLREELAAVESERPSHEEIAALPYLDAVVREGLRLLPPATSTIREAKQTTVVPLGTPIRGRDGKMMDTVTLQAGTTVFLPIMPVNTSQDRWGSDAEDFNPDRFLSPPPESTKEVPGVWGNMLTFLGGTRSCIGYRFALAEMKAILFVLMRNFEFEELKSKPQIEKRSACVSLSFHGADGVIRIVMRSKVVGEETQGYQMPLMVKPISA